MINNLRLLLFLLSITIAGAGCGPEISSLLRRLAPASSEVAETGPAPATASANERQFTINLISASNGLEQLGSYRVNLIVNFDGTRRGQISTGHIESLSEINRPANALHHYLNVDATIPDAQDLAGISQFFRVENKTYISKAGEVVRFETATDNHLSPGEIDFLELDKLIILPAAVSRPPKLERLDGRIVRRYTFNQSDLAAPNITFEAAQGDLWINNAGGSYLVQYVISATMKILAPIPRADILDEGTLNLSYKLTDINADFAINLPENIEEISDPFAAFPPPPEAELVTVYPTLIEYTSVISPISVTHFYRTGLPTRGWVEKSAEIFNEKARLTFAKDNEILTVIITPLDDPNQIKIVLDLVTR